MAYGFKTSENRKSLARIRQAFLVRNQDVGAILVFASSSDRQGGLFAPVCRNSFIQNTNTI
jgi:hypothetical protein